MSNKRRIDWSMMAILVGFGILMAVFACIQHSLVEMYKSETVTYPSSAEAREGM